MDSFEGSNQDPLSLHKYHYSGIDPVNNIDPSWHESVVGMSIATSIATTANLTYNGAAMGAGFSIYEKLTQIADGKTIEGITQEFQDQFDHPVSTFFSAVNDAIDGSLGSLDGFCGGELQVLPTGWAPVKGSENAYSVAWEGKLPASKIQANRPETHFQEMNRQLLQKMNSDPEFARMVETLIPNVRSQLVGSKGGISTKPPTGWTWHHESEIGMIQLVPKIQHQSGGKLWILFHGGKNGKGWAKWGKIR